MKNRLVCLTAAITMLAGPGFSHAVKKGKPGYAQVLANRVIQENPDMLDILFHVTPAGQAKNIVIAAHIAKDLGEVSGDDDMGVMQTGKPIVEVQKDGIRIGVLVQLRDKKGHAIGALGLMYPYKKSDDQAKVLARSNAIRDRLAARIKNVDEVSKI